MRKTTRLFLTFACFMVLSACVYRANIAQGNLIERKDLDQVEIGMTKSQIRFLLGTPMINDPFTANRWDYVYYLTIGRRDAVQKRWVSIYFVDEKVSEIRKNLELAPEL
ncbi:MAG TPA: outer membrane protein assembly factor BamE [Woeseiaceae bacterium]|nr:outer membrane protein assembly factor BamE [Woeseiaceae bacterium]